MNCGKEMASILRQYLMSWSVQSSYRPGSFFCFASWPTANHRGKRQLSEGSLREYYSLQEGCCCDICLSIAMLESYTARPLRLCCCYFLFFIRPLFCTMVLVL